MPVNKAGALVNNMDPDPKASLLKFLGPDAASRFVKAGAGKPVKKAPLNAPAAAKAEDGAS